MDEDTLLWHSKGPIVLTSLLCNKNRFARIILSYACTLIRSKILISREISIKSQGR